MLLFDIAMARSDICLSFIAPSNRFEVMFPYDNLPFIGCGVSDLNKVTITGSFSPTFQCVYKPV